VPPPGQQTAADHGGPLGDSGLAQDGVAIFQGAEDEDALLEEPVRAAQPLEGGTNALLPVAITSAS
jgi:hypothetical protein